MAEVSQAVPVTILVGIGAFFLSMIILAIVILRRRFLSNTVRFSFITDAGHIERVRYKRKNILKTFIYSNGMYVYDPKSEITTWLGKEIYYFKNNPKPIHFKNGTIDSDSMSSENFKEIMEMELISKLFKKEKFGMDTLLMTVSILLGVVSVILIFSVYNGGVDLKDTPENIDILSKALKQALAS